MSFYIVIAMIATVLTGVFTYVDYKNGKATKEHLSKILILCGVTFALELFVLPIS